VKGADWLRLTGTVTLLALAWRLAGGDAVVSALAGLDVRWLLAAVALTVPMHLLSAARWTFTCRRIGVALDMPRAVADYYLASLLNLLLPGGVAGDVVRTWRQARAGPHGPGSLRGPIHGVMLERGAGQLALLVVLGVGAALHLDAWSQVPARAWWLLPGAAAAAAALLAAPRLRAALGALARDARAAFLPARVLAAQAVLSLAVVACYVGIFACAAAAVAAPLNPGVALLAVPLVLTAMALPVSVGGTGPRELAAAALWPLFALPASDGAATALVYGLAVLLGSVPGAAVLLARRGATS